MRQLTQRNIQTLTDGKRHWSEKKKHLIRIAKQIGIIIKSDEELKYLIEVHCVNEDKRLTREFFLKSKTGEIMSEFTPTDVKGNFDVVTEPIIGNKYHISWAYSGARFKLIRIENEYCFLDNPRYKRDTLLKCKISELRALR